MNEEINKLTLCSYCRPIEDYENKKKTQQEEEASHSLRQDFQPLHPPAG